MDGSFTIYVLEIYDFVIDYNLLFNFMMLRSLRNGWIYAWEDWARFGKTWSKAQSAAGFMWRS